MTLMTNVKCQDSLVDHYLIKKDEMPLEWMVVALGELTESDDPLDSLVYMHQWPVSLLLSDDDICRFCACLEL